MAIFSEYAPVIDSLGLPTVQPGFRVPSGDPSLGIATIGPGYAVPQSQLGDHVVQSATLINPRTGYPYGPAPGQSGNAGLGIINESDAWLTGRPYGLPGTTAIKLVRRPDGHYDSHLLGAQLGDIPNDFQSSVDLQYVPVRQGWYVGRELRVDQPAGLGLVSNEVQRSVGFGGVSDKLGLDLGIFGRTEGKIMLGVIGGTIVLGIIGAIVAAD